MASSVTTLSRQELQSAIVRDPLVVTPETPVIEAIARMSGLRSQCDSDRNAESQALTFQLEPRACCALVVSDGQLVGILTERDVVQLGAQQTCLEGLTLTEVMTQTVVTLKESDFTNVFVALDLLRRYKIRHVPVVDDRDRLVGILTHETLRQLARPGDLLRLRSVAEVMVPHVFSATPSTSMLAVAQLMAAERISCVIIVEPDESVSPEVRNSGAADSTACISLPGHIDSETAALQIPIGILTERDLVQFQALGLALDQHKAGAFMSSPVFAVKSGDSLWNAEDLMERHFIRRVVVTGDHAELLGIMTQSSLLQALNPLELYHLTGVLEAQVRTLEAEKIALLETKTTVLEEQVRERTAHLQAQAEQNRLVADLALQIRSSLNLSVILQTTVDRIQAVLGCDRVTIWQFDADWTNTVVAEATTSEVSLLGTRVQDSCLQSGTGKLATAFVQGRIRIVPDIHAVEMSDCHRELLMRLHTRAKVLIPLLCDGELWGLLKASESQQARDWQPHEVELLQSLANHLAIAIDQATTHEKLAAELQLRRETETRLSESEQRYAALTNAVPVAILRSDQAGHIIFLNERWSQLSGLTVEASLGEGWIAALHPEDRDWVVAKTQAYVLQGVAFQHEYRLLRPDGQVVWVYEQTEVEHNADGQMVGHIGTLTDISDRKQTEIALQTSEAKYSAVVNALPDLVIRMSREGINLDFFATDNYNFLGNPQDYTGTHVADFFDPDLAQRRLQAAQAALDTQSVQVYEQTLVNEGQPQIEEVRIVPYTDDEVVLIIRDITQRHQTEMALRALEQENQAILAALPDLIIVLDADETFQRYSYNTELHEIVPIHPQPAGLSLRELLPPPEASRFSAAVKRVLQTGQVEVFEQQLQFDDGLHYEEVRVVPYRNNQVLGMIRDVTHRKQAEIALRELEQENQAILAAIPDLIIVLDADGTYKRFNYNAELSEIVPIHPQPVGLSLRELLPPPEAERFSVALKHVLQTGQIDIFEHQLQLDDGLHYEEVRMVPYRNNQVLCMVRDVTQRKQAELRLTESEHRYATLAATAPVGIFRTDIAGNCTYVNDRWSQISGFSAEETLGPGWRNAVDPDDLDWVAAAWQQANEQETSFHREFHLLRPDGQTVWVYVQAEAERDATGQMVGYVGTHTDISDRKQAELAIKNLIEGTTVTGADFFPSLVLHITQALGVPYGLVSELRDGELYVLAFAANGTLKPTFSYSPSPTPCKFALRDGRFYVESSVQEKFPVGPDLLEINADSYLGIAIPNSQGQAIGALCILDTKPIQQVQRAEEILRVFATRAGAELERQHTMDQLTTLNAELERRVNERTATLQEREQFLTIVLDTFPLAVFWKDRQGVYQGCNRLFAEASGLASPEEAIGKSNFDFGYPEAEAQSYTEDDQQIMQSGVAKLAYEQSFVNPAGEQRWLETNKIPMRDITGQVAGLVCTFQDITERKQAELALEQESLHRRTVFNASSDGIHILDIEGNLIEANTSFLESIGYTLEEAKHLNASDWDAQLTPAEIRAHLQNYVWGNGGLLRIETLHRHKEGWVFPVEVSICAMEWHGQKSFVCAARDISERKQAEALLRQRSEDLARSEKDLRTIFNNVDDGIMIYDFDGSILDVNNRYLEMLGATREQVMAASFADFTTPGVSAEQITDILQQVADGQHLRFEWPVQRLNDGTPWYADVSLKNVILDNRSVIIASTRDVTDREMAERALQASQARFRRMTDNVPGMIHRYVLHTDGSHELIYVDSQIRDIFELEPEAVLQDITLIWARIHPDDAPRVAAAVQESAETLQPLTSEHRLLLPEKGLRWVQLFSRPERLANGDVAWDGLVLDISDRKASEVELQRLSDRLELALASAEIGIWEWNFQTEELSWDDRMLAIYGVRRETFRGTFQDWADRVHPDDFAQASLDLSDSNDHFVNEFRIIRPDGAIRHIFSAALRQRDEEGQPTRVVGVNLDISDRKAAIEQMRASEQRYASLTAAAPVGIFRTDAMGNGTYLSDTWCAIAGLTQEEALGEGWKEALHPDDRDKVAAEWDQSLQDHRPARIECRFQRPDGTIIWVYAQSVAEYNAAGEIIGCVGTITDITAQKAAEAQLEQTNVELLRATRLKDEFLANMSHEIRTPMNAILGMTELTLGTTLTIQQRNYLNKIKTSAGLLLHIINDILDFSKIEAGKLTLETTAFSLDAVLSNLHSVNSLEAQRKGVEFTFEIDADTPRQLVGDPLRLGQVLLNLVSNAIKFTEQGSVVIRIRAVTATAEECTLHFSVTDTGLGISPQQKARLFQAFSQGDTSTTRRFGGTGLGLIISQRLVQLMQGEIGMESTHGQGSTFWFTAVFQKPADNQPNPPPPLVSTITRIQKRRSLSLDGLHILLVEDNEINQELALEFLTQAGAIVCVVQNGREAYNSVRQVTFDVVLMDCQMPIMDGYVATRLIRALPEGGEIPIIAMTAHAMSGDRQRCLDAGMNDYIAKPIVKENLFSMIYKFVVSHHPPSVPSDLSPASPAIDESPSSEFSALSSFDLDLGLRYVGNNPQLYTKLLQQFLTKYSPFAEQIHGALQAKDYAAATRLAHSLKGLSGTLGCINLQQQAQNLEHSIKEHEDSFDQAVLSTVIGTLTQVLAELETWSQTQPKPSNQTLSPDAIDWQAANQLIIRIEAALDTDLGTALKDLKSLQNMLQSAVDAKALLEKLTMALDGFNLDGARETLAALQKLAQTHH
ncbi:MAG: PAS domain S-box protein [Leptolyngbya sp. SIOISBB]|nr:PAS domain S-box protein [Leptolyngbya sp. SIOISBB]